MMLDISPEHNEARLGGTLNFLDTGSGNARIRIYDGTKPAPGGAVTTLLVEVALDKPSGVVTAGVLILASSDLPLIANSGTATWARVINGADGWVFDCDVSDTAGTGVIKLPDTTLYAGGKTQMASGALG